MCTKIFKSPPDLELHVNIEHRDILSPASSQPQSCPVCEISLDNVSNNSKHLKQMGIMHGPGKEWYNLLYLKSYRGDIYLPINRYQQYEYYINK